MLFCNRLIPWERVARVLIVFDSAPGEHSTPKPEGEMMNGSEPSLICLEAVSKVFYTDEVETHALDGIHLGIRKGEYVSIEGPSGCGKSTLLSIPQTARTA